MGNDKDKLIDDLNSILKENFDYIPVSKVTSIADELIKRGWKCNEEPKRPWPGLEIWYC